MQHEQSGASKRYAFFQHTNCEYFPCHGGVAPEEFNCLFCYCPLYALGRSCGGNCAYTAQGIKDCSGCSVPHRRENYDLIMSRFPELARLAAETPVAPSQPESELE